MAGPFIHDRVAETTTTTGTGTLTLGGAVTGYQAWSVVGDGGVADYVIVGVDGNGVPTGEWETGRGTYTAGGTTLSRDTVYQSSNGNALVNLSAGTKRVYLAAPSHLVSQIPGNENYLANGGMWFASRQNPFSSVAVTSGTSGGASLSADNWRVEVNSGSSILYQRWDRLASGWASGVDAEFYGAWTMGNSGSFLLYQPVPAADSQAMANKNIIFQFQARAAASGFIARISHLQTVSGVSPDTIPNNLASGWTPGISGTEPSFGSGVQKLVPAADIAVSDKWQVFSLTARAASGHACLIPAVYVNYPLPSGTALHMTEAGLYYND